jgi:hypothetical protein
MFNHQIVKKNLQMKKNRIKTNKPHLSRKSKFTSNRPIYRFCERNYHKKNWSHFTSSITKLCFYCNEPNLAIIIYYNLLQQEFKHSDSLTNYIDRPSAMRIFKKLVKAKQTAEIFF